MTIGIYGACPKVEGWSVNDWMTVQSSCTYIWGSAPALTGSLPFVDSLILSSVVGSSFLWAMLAFMTPHAIFWTWTAFAFG
jgi:hypothetical protein